MKKVFKIILLIICFMSVLNIAGIKDSHAAVSSTQEITNNKKDLFILVESVENGRRYLAVYTCDGILVTKVEEL